MSENSSKKKKRRKRKKKSNTKKIVLTTLLIVVLLVVGVFAGSFIYANTLLNKMDKVTLDESDLGINTEVDKELSKYDSIENIALFGVDASNGGTGRSDSIMILTIDSERKELRLSSILRDSYVEIPGRGKDKINHAYAFGGPELALNTINSTYGLNIKDFVTVDFSSLPKIIDYLGGIEVNITQEELNSKYLKEHIEEVNEMNGTSSPLITKTGPQLLDGTQALAYARIRYTSDGDEGRTVRHQVVFNALLDKFKTTSPTQYPRLLSELMPMVKTSLSTSKILDLATDVLGLGNISLNTRSFPSANDSNGIMVNGVYYLDFNKDVTVKSLHDFMFNAVKE